MNFIFISPHFPLYFYNFCDRLKKRGVNVLGIGDSPYDSLPDRVKNSLTEYYYVHSLENYDEVYKATGFYTFKYGRIDWIESQNEYWLETEAKLRKDFNVTTGPKIDTLEWMKYKSKMKAIYEKANIPFARYHVIENMDSARAFIEKVGYPVVVKPDNGVGASSTYKLKSFDEFQFFYDHRDPQVSYIMEEYVPGHVETFDGICDENQEIIICSSHVMLESIMDTVNESKDMPFINQMVKGNDIYEVGKRAVKAFETRNRFFHFEFFRLDEDKEGLGKKGDILGLEVNMRAPGAYMPEMINYGYDCDIYDVYSQMVTKSLPDTAYEQKYVVAYAGRKKASSYKHNHEEIMQKLGPSFLQCEQVPAVLAKAMGDTVYLFRCLDKEDLLDKINFVMEK